jgi:AraC-like DNA-binding protein
MQELIKASPDKAVLQIDSALHRGPEASLTDEGQLQLRQWRQEAFHKLGNADSVFEEALRIQSLARHLDDSLAYARALLSVTGDIEESKFKYLENAYPLSIGIFSRRKLHREQAILMSAEAFQLNNIGNYEASQRLALEAIALPGVYERDSLRAYLYQTIGRNFQGNNARKRSFEYFRKALGIAQVLPDSMMQSKILLDFGILHYEEGTDSARFFYKQAMAILPRERGRLQRIKILYNIAVQDFEQDLYAPALAGFRDLLAVSLKERLPTGEAVAYKALGFYHEANGSPDSAIYYLEKSIRLADSIQQPFLRIQGLIELEKAYRTSGQQVKAFELHQKTDKIRDSIFTVDNRNIIHGLEMRFNTERTGLENKTLRQDLYLRKVWIILLSILLIAFLSILWLVRQRSRLWQARVHSYAVLMNKYKTEKMAAEAAMLELTPPSDAIIRPAFAGKKPPQAPSVKDPTYIELQHLFQVKAVYKDPNLRIEDVSQWLNVTPRQISAVLKAREASTFIQYVNQFRIKEARRIMEDPSSDSLKLEAIGEMAGIPTRSNFYKLFESIVGVPPGHYRRNIIDPTSVSAEGAED